MPPSSGVVNYQGRPVSFGRGAEVAQRAAGRPIGFVFQQFNLIPSLSVLDNVALPLLYQAGAGAGCAGGAKPGRAGYTGIADKAGQQHITPIYFSGGYAEMPFSSPTSMPTLTSFVTSVSSISGRVWKWQYIQGCANLLFGQIFGHYREMP